MNFIQMKCPNCNADLEVEDGLDSFFCKYCGTKVLLHGQSNAAYTAKTVNNIANRLLDQREVRRAEKAEERRKQAEHDRKMQPYILAVGLILIIIVFIGLFFMSSKDEKHQPIVKESTNSEYAMQGTIDAINDVQHEVQGVADAYNNLMDTFNQFGK